MEFVEEGGNTSHTRKCTWVVALGKLCRSSYMLVAGQQTMHIPVISFPHTDAATIYFSIYFDVNTCYSKMGTQLKSA